MYVGTGHDVSAAAAGIDALDADRPWSAAAVSETELPDFSPPRRWTSVVLAAAGIVALAALVAAVITMANRTSHPAQETPPVPGPTTASATRTATAPLPAPSSVPSAAPLPPPDFSSVTATASTLAPPPPARPGQPEPKPGVRERLRDLFPRLFPDR